MVDQLQVDVESDKAKLQDAIIPNDCHPKTIVAIVQSSDGPDGSA